MFWQPSTSKGVCLSQLTLDVTVVWISTKWRRHQMSGDSENKHWCNLLHNYVWQSAAFVWFGINMALGSEGLAFCLHQPACICLSVDLCVYLCALSLTSHSLLTQGSFSSPGISYHEPHRCPHTSAYLRRHTNDRPKKWLHPSLAQRAPECVEVTGVWVRVAYPSGNPKAAPSYSEWRFARPSLVRCTQLVGS